jgi:hypothetical protein
MPFEEYVYRFNNFISSIFNFFSLKLGKEFLPNTCLPEKNRLKESIFCDAFENDIRKILPDRYTNQCISEADQILHNRFSFFDLENEYLGNKINWNFDYKNKITFPLRYSFFGSRSFRKIGDIKYAFEINKHQELVRLSEAYILTGDESYTNKLVENINTWMQQCPYRHSVNWASPTVMAYRLVSWTISFEMLRWQYTFSDQFLHQWAQSVYQHIHLIRKNYSKFSSAGNHLISEAVGVFVACLGWRIFFKGKELSFLDVAQKEAYSILLNEVETQIFPDGVNHEQAISYQVFAANQFFIALFFGINSGVLFPDGYHKSLHECAKFLSSVLNKEGNPPKFGDEDSAWTFRFCDRKSNKFLDQLAVFAVFFNDFSLLSKNQLSETAYWLFGSQAVQIEQFRADKIAQIDEQRQGVEENIFSHGGYYIASFNRNSEKEVLTFFDFGPLGSQSTGAHGHADALSVCLSIGGEWIFIDPGTYHYKNSIERKSLRVTSAHNTLNFGDFSSQDQYLGPFLWGKRHISFGKSLDSGQFKGSVTWYSGEIHSREISVSKNRLWIFDSWNGKNYPAIVCTISQNLYRSVSLGEDDVVFICSNKFTCHLKASGCSVVIEDVKVSPDFYQLVDSKKIVIYPKKYSGKQTIEIGWEFY